MPLKAETGPNFTVQDVIDSTGIDGTRLADALNAVRQKPVQLTRCFDGLPRAIAEPNSSTVPRRNLGQGRSAPGQLGF